MNGSKCRWCAKDEGKFDGNFCEAGNWQEKGGQEKIMMPKNRNCYQIRSNENKYSVRCSIPSPKER